MGSTWPQTRVQQHATYQECNAEANGRLQICTDTYNIARNFNVKNSKISFATHFKRYKMASSGARNFSTSSSEIQLLKGYSKHYFHWKLSAIWYVHYTVAMYTQAYHSTYYTSS